MRKFIYCFFICISFLRANTVQFKGSFFDFKIKLEDDFTIVNKDSIINKTLKDFTDTKGDLALAREFYTDTSKPQFDATIKDEASRVGFTNWLKNTSLVCKAIIKKENGNSTAFLHLNEGTSGSMIMLAEIDTSGDKPKIVFGNFVHPKSGDPEYWIVQFWNSMPNLIPVINE